MPSFSTDGHRYYIIYITGPCHILLGLEWAVEPVASVFMERISEIGGHGNGELSERRITEEVTLGIAEANQQLGVAYAAAKIIYVANDSPRYDLFQHYASLLVQHHAEGGYFERCSTKPLSP